MVHHDRRGALLRVDLEGFAELYAELLALEQVKREYKGVRP